MRVIDLDPESASFRRLHRDDFPLLHKWLNEEHVRTSWFSDGMFPANGYSLETVIEDFSPDLESNGAVNPYLIYYQHVPIGYVQTWRIADFPAYAGSFIDDDTPMSDAASLDMFIGDPAYVARGIGPAVLRVFLRQVVFAEHGVTCVIINPEAENSFAIRAYERAGFRHTMTIATSDGAITSYIMRIDRQEILPGQPDS